MGDRTLIRLGLERGDRYTIQFSKSRPEILMKCLVLFVTRRSWRDLATATIMASSSPVGLPIYLSSAWILPNSSAAKTSKLIIGISLRKSSIDTRFCSLRCEQ